MDSVKLGNYLLGLLAFFIGDCGFIYPIRLTLILMELYIASYFGLRAFFFEYLTLIIFILISTYNLRFPLLQFKIFSLVLTQVRSLLDELRQLMLALLFLDHLKTTEFRYILILVFVAIRRRLIILPVGIWVDRFRRHIELFHRPNYLSLLINLLIDNIFESSIRVLKFQII